MCDFKERVGKLEAVVNSRTEPIAILVAQIDPDAVASALALRMLVRLLSHNQRGTQIFYAGAVSHPQNTQLLYRYGLTPAMFQPVAKFDRSGSCIALVDSCSTEDARLSEIGKIDPIIVIDHHRADNAPVEKDDSFILIEDVGAASTLAVKLIEASEKPFPRDYDWVATILTLGIYTDTKSLVSAGHKDQEAYAWVRKLAKESDLHDLIHFRLPPAFYHIQREALTNMTSKEGKLVAGVGMIRPDEGDFLAIIADSLIRMQNVSVAVVWGIVGNCVRISARSADLTVPLDQFLAQRFGANAGAKLAPDGHGEGGGMLGIDLGLWLSEGTKTTICEMVRTRMAELVFGN